MIEETSLIGERMKEKELEEIKQFVKTSKIIIKVLFVLTWIIGFVCNVLLLLYHLPIESEAKTNVNGFVLIMSGLFLLMSYFYILFTTINKLTEQ